MSRTSLYRPRRHRAVCHRPATGTRLLPTPHSRLNHSLGWGIPLALSRVKACPEPRRRGSQERNGRSLLPSPFPPITPHLDSHYKRCPKALRLRLSSDQSPSRPQHGRSPDKSRHSLSKGHCQVRAPLTRRIRLAPSGDAPEHGVIVLPRAIAPPWASAPFSDSPGVDLAGQSEQSYDVRLKTNAPFKDSTVVTTGELRSTNGGHGSTLPSLRMVEHFWWTGLPHTENFSGLVHIPSEVRGKDSTVVTTGELPTTNAGHGSPLPSLGMVEHFWWSRLPHSETSSRLFHIPSEVRGCRRVVADVKRPQGRTPRIVTGVAGIMRNRPGPSTPIPFFSVIPSLLPSNELEAEAGAKAPASASVLISPSPLKALRERGIKGVRVPLRGRGVSPAEALESLSQSGRGSGRIHPSRTTTYNPTPSPRKNTIPKNNQNSRLSPRINQKLPMGATPTGSACSPPSPTSPCSPHHPPSRYPPSARTPPGRRR